MNALAIRPRAAPALPFGLRADLVLLDQVLVRLDHGHAADRDVDADIYEALGWEVIRAPYPLRRMGWRCRSPIAMGWEPLPNPTADMNAAARLRPDGWDYGFRSASGKATAWCADPRRPTRFAEQNRLTPARALTCAALHARRMIALGG